MILSNLKRSLFADIEVIPEALQQSHLPGLDGLRGISIILVILSHVFKDCPIGGFFEGFVGVKIFFVISGFLITTLLLKEKVNTGSVSFKSFYIRRILRIIPVSYLFLLTLLLFNSYFKISALSFATAFLYIKNIPLKGFGEWYTGHFWSLSVEEQFYILFPFFMVTYLNRYIKIIAVMILIIPCLNLLCYGDIGIFYTNKTLHQVSLVILAVWGRGTVDILIGSLLSILVFKKIITIERLKGGYYTSFIILIIVIALRTIDLWRYYYYVIDFFIPFAVGYVILLNLKGKNFLREILSNKILVQTGILSYSLYIWQQPFTTNIGADYVKMIYSVVIIIAVSLLSYYCFEKRFLKLKSHFK